MQPFENVSYQQQLHHLQDLVEKVLPCYGLQGAKSFLLQYEDNAVYLITTCTGERFVLRISAAEGQSAVEQWSEMQWLQALRRETHLLVPEPIPTHDGTFVMSATVTEILEPRQCVLLSWISGEPPEPGIQLEIVERIGAFTAYLHLHSEHFVPPTGFVRPSWDWERLFGVSSVLNNEKVMVSLTHYQQEVLLAVSTKILQALNLIDKDASSWGLIHADLHRDNILLHNEKVGIIDFDDCGWGYYLFDVASVLDSFYRRVVTSHEGYPMLKEAYLTGYSRVRALPAHLDTSLRIFKVMRDMVNVNFILSSKNLNVQAWGYQRLEKILAQFVSYLEDSLDCTI
ncbi:MAG TPA: hypothetical protein DHW02_10985 [Ktedonobacter sp.]|nr:hypothetical protein [Ktedonobacter sp.]